MTRNSIFAVALTATAVALSGCLDTDDPLGPIAQCDLNTGTVAVEGDTLTLEPGIRYIQRQEGSEAEAKLTDVVDVCYVGRFTDGQVFDAGQLPPVTIGQGQLIPGFEKGLVGIGVDGIRRLIVSPEQGYGDEPVRNQQGQVVIPANSTLVFDVQLLRIR